MSRIAIMLLVATGCWIYPAPRVAAAFESQDNSAQFINYEQYHKKPEENKVVNSKPMEKPKKVSTAISQNEIQSGWHSTKTDKRISVEALNAYLVATKSPLAPYSAQILKSPHWSTIIGVCSIEQYNCTHAPGNNYWGLMCPGKGLCKYASLEEGIKAISARLVKYDANGHDTIEKLNGYYVVPASSNWLNTVIKVKTKLESL